MYWNLDDREKYILIYSFKFPRSFTYADTRKGHTDIEKREYIRSEAVREFPKNLPNVQWWAFRIFIEKTSARPFDIENVPKLIVDSFCKRQIQKDRSKYIDLGLYEDDTIDYVKIVTVGGTRVTNSNFTKVEIFGSLK